MPHSLYVVACYPTFEKPHLINKITISEYALKLMKLLNIVYKILLILNFLPLIVFYIFDNKPIKELIGFGFFYMVIWVLIPCILLSTSLYIYNRKNMIFRSLDMKRHWKLVAISISSFVVVIINGIIYVNLFK